MHKTLFALTTLLALLPKLALDAQTPPGVPPPSVTLSASMERPVCPEGQPAVLVVALHNDRVESLVIGGWSEASSFQITVTDGTGRAMLRTADGDRVLTPAMQSGGPMGDFSSGQTIRYRFNLARLFDLSRAGDYTVSVSRRLRPWVRPRPVVVTLPQEIALSAGPLKIRMTEDAAATSGLTAFAPPLSRQTFLYIVGRYDEGVSHYLIGEDGSVSFSMAYSRLGSPRVAKGADSLAATPDGRFLYVGNGSAHTVSQFRIGDNGVLFPLPPSTVPAHPFPGPLLMDPKGRFLYNLSGTLYAIGPDGRLTVTASVANDPPGKNDRAENGNVVASYSGEIDPTGTFLYTCGGLICGHRLAPDGVVTALPPTSGALGPNGGNDNAFALSPSGKLAFAGVSAKGLSAGFDHVVPMRVEADGTLTPLPGAAQTPPSPPLPSPGFQPFSCTTLVVDPTGHFLVVVNPGYLDCYRIGPDGLLTLLSMTTQMGDLTSVFFGPAGHFVYALNRNPFSLTAFQLDEQRGLTPSGLGVTNGVPFDACMTSATAPTPLKWGEVVGGLMVSAHLPGDVLPANKMVALTVTLKNVTARPIRLGTADADMASFRLTLAGPTRQISGPLSGPGEPAVAAVPLLAAGHDLLDAPGTGGAALALPPGGERQYRFVLSRLADLTVAGFYTIQVSRVLPGGKVVGSPVLRVLLEGPFDGIRRDGSGSGLDVL